jgi:hypothetical protein
MLDANSPRSSIIPKGVFTRKTKACQKKATVLMIARVENRMMEPKAAPGENAGRLGRTVSGGADRERDRERLRVCGARTCSGSIGEGNAADGGSLRVVDFSSIKEESSVGCGRNCG